jgi:hypothetical protein
MYARCFLLENHQHLESSVLRRLRLCHSPLVKSPWPILGECLPNAAQTSTLPLSEGDILHHAKLVPEVNKLRSGQRLGENVCYLLICGYVLKLHRFLLHHVSDEVLQEAFKATLLHDLRYWLRYTLSLVY